MVSKKSRTVVRENKHRKLRNRFSGTAERPRLAVFRSNNHMYAQIIDDTVGNTLVSASTLDKDLKAEVEKTNNVDAAAKLGTVIAKKALDKGIPHRRRWNISARYCRCCGRVRRLPLTSSGAVETSRPETGSLM